MSIVSISRIQQRRGKKNDGTGLPQLASGELAWCIDSQELYIGNGSVSEGAPGVGNTKILTSLDIASQGDLLNVFQRIFKSNDTTISTGVGINHPVSRPIQSRLDDRVTTRDFGVIGDPAGDDTEALQRAINQLFLNGAGTAVKYATNRTTLVIPAGIYNISNTIYIPSYTTLVGEGSEKTIINHTGTSTVFRCVNDLSTIGNPAGMGSSLIDTNQDGLFTNDSNDVQYSNQPRFINISGLSIVTSSADQTALQLDAVRDSKFDDITLQGNWGNVANENSKALALYAFSAIVTCERNVFTNVNIKSFTYGIHSSQDIKNNVFDNGYITDVKQGIALGKNTDGASIGQQYGPRDTHVNNYKFYNIKQHAVYIERGSGNSNSNLSLINVGNDGGGNTIPLYPQIYFNTYENSCTSIKTDRNDVLSLPNLQIPYIPEMSGHGIYESFGTKQLSIGEYTIPHSFLRLPVACSSIGEPKGSISYNLHYIYKSTNFYSRAGLITIVVDIEGQEAKITDDYSYVGINAEVNSLALEFQVQLLDYLGNVFVGAPNQIPYSINVTYTNTVSGDFGYFSYKYIAIF